MSRKSIKQECQERVLSKNVKKRMSSKSVQQEYLRKVSSKNVNKSIKQKCQIRISWQECQDRVSSKSVKQECPARVLRKSVKQENGKQECPVRRCCSLMILRVISIKKKNNIFISALIFVHSFLHKVTAFGFMGSIWFLGQNVIFVMTSHACQRFVLCWTPFFLTKSVPILQFKKGFSDEVHY